MRQRRRSLVMLMVLALLTLGAAPPAPPAPPAGVVSAQEAVRPQLPRLLDFELRPTSAGSIPDADAFATSAKEQWAAPSLGSGSQRAITVRDALTDEHLLDIRADKALTPASTTKILTAAAIMSALEPQQTFTTRVVRSGKAGVVLVAGGDQLLAEGKGRGSAVAGRAGLDTLAAKTARALKEEGVEGSITVRLDTSYADGLDVAPGWTDFWVENGFAGRISMVALEQDRALPYAPAPADPAMKAAKSFAASLAEHDVAVSTEKITRIEEDADAEVTELASVESAPLRDVLALALVTSDNAMVEQLARQAAIAAGGQGDQDSVNLWVLETLASAYDVDINDAVLADTSGLSDGTELPMRVVADVLVAGASGRYPALQSVLTGLPIAGYNGTMRDRFDVAESRIGHGVVRAKTGSLPAVSAMAGTVVTDDGRLVVFALTVNDVGSGLGEIEARAAIDALVADLAACGC